MPTDLLLRMHGFASTGGLEDRLAGAVWLLSAIPCLTLTSFEELSIVQLIRGQGGVLQ